MGGPGFDSMSPPSRSSKGTQGDWCPPAEKTAALEGKIPRGARVVRFASASSKFPSPSPALVPRHKRHTSWTFQCEYHILKIKNHI